MQSQTTETQEKIENGLHCVRTRTKIECIGTGTVNCTPTDWTDWSIWTCG